MLNITRNIGQKIRIGGNIIITVKKINRGKQVMLGIEAPRDIKIDREEIYLLKEDLKLNEELMSELLYNQEPLGEDFEKILHNNLEELYEN